MSRQLRPSPSRAGIAERERRDDLDGLQDDPVGHAGARADAVGGEHDGAGGLEDAHVRGRRGQHRAEVHRQQDRRGCHQPCLGLQAEREQHRVAGEPLQRPREQLAGDRRGAVAGSREHHQALAREPQQPADRHRREHRFRRARATREREQARAGDDQDAHREGQRQRAREARQMTVQKGDAGEGRPRAGSPARAG